MSEDNMSQLMNTLKTMLNNNSTSSTDISDNSINSSSATSKPANNNSYDPNSENSNFNISPEMINNMANVLKNSSFNNTESKNSNQSENSNSSLDFETIMKIKSMMDMLNKKDDPRSNLLYSLKPYLRKSRQDKLDQYANLFKITQVANIFNLKKGDNK